MHSYPLISVRTGILRLAHTFLNILPSMFTLEETSGRVHDDVYSDVYFSCSMTGRARSTLRLSTI